MADPKTIRIEDFDYDLPQERIAKFPLDERDASKLLVFKNRNIEESTYQNLADYIPENAALVFNNTKVVQARMHFVNRNNRPIEIFCLEPADRYADLAVAMSQTNSVEWICMVGGAKKWKEDFLTREVEVNEKRISLKAQKKANLDGTFLIQFTWQPADLSFAELLDAAGITPLPPYLKREAESIDKDRYQTIYAAHDGSVAAPTAGLHFTDRVFSQLENKKIERLFVTLHVGAGTFKPVQSELIADHDMHFEYIHVQTAAIKSLLERKEKNIPIIAVGTTSMRTLESLYWLGVKASLKPDVALKYFEVLQWDPYELETKLTVEEALQSLIDWLTQNELSELITRTQLMIAPGYDLKLIDGLVTNFHQPKSTLLLLISAIVGDQWKLIYQYAMDHNFRFLSYGDGSLLLK